MEYSLEAYLKRTFVPKDPDNVFADKAEIKEALGCISDSTFSKMRTHMPKCVRYGNRKCWSYAAVEAGMKSYYAAQREQSACA